jgi:ABC-type transport system involved in multi-copper enzyme maturation permease subunit
MTAVRALWVLIRHGLGLLLGGKRLWITGVLVALALLPAAAIAGGSGAEGSQIAIDLDRQLVLPLLVPVVALVFSVAAGGDELRDGTIVNLVTKPYPRDLVLAAKYLATVGAVLVVLVPMQVLAHVLAARGLGSATVLWASLLATLIGTLTWSALGLLLGLLISRALLIGLAWTLLWEGAVAGVAPGAAAVSVRGWTEGVLSAAVRPEGLEFATRLGPVTSLVSALAVAAVAFLLAARRLHRMDLR